MWSKVHFFFFSGLYATKPLETNSKTHNPIHKMAGRKVTGKKLADSFYKRLSLQECGETSASGVVSQCWSFFSFLAFLLPFPLFDVLCPDHMHMEVKGDTGGLIHCQRHAKTIWALNQT